MVGYHEDAYIVSVKSVVCLSESQLRIFILKSAIRLGLSLFFSRESFSRSGLITCKFSNWDVWMFVNAVNNFFFVLDSIISTNVDSISFSL